MKKEERVRKIAEDIYLTRKKNDVNGDSLKDWTEAESICNNELKYIWWLIGKYHYRIIAIVAIFSSLINIIMMAWSIKTNMTSTDLNTRPYVSVNIENPKRFIQGNDTFYGNNIILNNKGKIPAANIYSRYYITSDADKENRHGLNWFDKNLGGFGSTSFMAPDAVEVEPGLRSLSPSAEYYYFEAITSYEGIGLNKKYWTRVKKVFYVDKNTNNLYAVNTYGEWDRNKNFVPPSISTKEEVVNLLEGIKSKRK